MTAFFEQIDRTTRLEATELTMSRGETTLFEELSAQLLQGDVLWIQGDNGIGKTTLLGTLAGLFRPDSGKVSWIYNERPSLASDLIAYQPHRSFAKSALSAKEDLVFWSKIYGTHSLTDQVLDYVGLSSRANVLTQNLSAGQRKRLALAKLIMSQKPIWIMDEPGAAMDKDGVALIDDLVSQHIKRGGSAVIASHGAPRKLGASTRKLTLSAAI